MKCIWLSRSDGTLETIGKNRIREPNEPTREQLDKSPNAQGLADYYHLIELGEDKEVEWRRKLGTLLQQYLGHLEQDSEDLFKEHMCNFVELIQFVETPWILGHLPQNYRLWEHVKTNITQTTTTGEFTRGQDNGRSINDRQDTYLYGHPGGRRKRYRSPADFFNHLLWLIEDEGGNPDNCTCKICAPDDIQMLEEFPVTKYPLTMEKAMRQLRSEDSAQTNQIQGNQASNMNDQHGGSQSSTVSTRPMVVIPKRTLSTDTMVKAPSSAKVGNPNSSVGTPRMPLSSAIPFPNPLAKLTSHEQSEDAIYAKYTYRPGEMVWFSRGESGAWGLAVITMRSVFSDRRYPTQKKPKYLVQQLCHPFSSFPLKIITDERDLRPWLAWSPPLLTHEGLRQKGSGVTYSNVDWRAVAAGHYGNGDMEVDGSILCAKDVDPSFSPVHPLPQNPAYPNDKLYNALYLGGEKIWVGEPVRLRNETSDILIAHKIVENISTTPSEFSIVGDIYHFTTVNYTPAFRPPTYNNLSNPTPSSTTITGSHTHTRQPSNSIPQYLPRRLLQDLDFRNRHSQPRTHTTSFWKCIAVSTRVPVKDVRGRWYESSTLLRILDPENYEAKLQRGIVDDTAVFLNARCGAIPGASAPSTSAAAASSFTSAPGSNNNNNPPPPLSEEVNLAQQGRLVKDRIEAFGAAVPKGTHISKGDDGPKELNQFPEDQGSIEREWAARQQVLQGVMMRQQAQQAQHQQAQGSAAESGNGNASSHAHGGGADGVGGGNGGGGGGAAGGGLADRDIAEFMDLDRMEDGYVQNFAEAGGQFFDGANGR